MWGDVVGMEETASPHPRTSSHSRGADATSPATWPAAATKPSADGRWSAAARAAGKAPPAATAAAALAGAGRSEAKAATWKRRHSAQWQCASCPGAGTWRSAHGRYCWTTTVLAMDDGGDDRDGL